MKKIAISGLLLSLLTVNSFALSDNINVAVTRDTGTYVYMFNGFPVKNISIKGMLDKLGSYSQITYIYHGKNIKLPDSPSVKITSIQDLKHYLEVTTNYSLKIIKKDKGWGIYDVYLVDKHSNPFLLQIKINATNLTGDYLLRKIAENLGYSLIISEDAKKSLEKKIKVVKVSNYYELINLLENNLDVFIDINNTSKTIKVKKYKVYSYQIGSLSPKVFKNLVLYLKTIVNKPNNFYVDKTNGLIVFKTDYLTYQKVNKIFNNYNINVKQNIRVKVYLFTVKSDKDIDWNYFENKISHTFSLEMMKNILANIGTILSEKKFLLNGKPGSETIFKTKNVYGITTIKIVPEIYSSNMIDIKLDFSLYNKYQSFQYSTELITHNNQKQLIGIETMPGIRYFIVVSPSFNPLNSE